MESTGNFKLTEALSGMKWVVSNEGDLEVERVIITKDNFMVVIDGTPYTVDNYEINKTLTPTDYDSQGIQN